MKRTLSDNFVRELKEFYTPGTKVKLLKMDDVQAPPVGTLGVVESVDDIGTIHIRWENGSTLGAAFGEDKVEALDKVVTICYHQKRTWCKRQDAIDFFQKGICSSEGSEKERYTKVYSQLLSGKSLCKDTDF